MISNILVASDGSEIAKKACEYAVELAKGLGARITLLFVIDQNILNRPVVPVSVTTADMMGSVEDYFRRVAETVLADLCEICNKEGVTARTMILKGHPVEEIVKAAEESKVDLIVVGSHGRSALKATVLGSVAFGVTHKDAATPVLIVRRSK